MLAKHDMIDRPFGAPLETVVRLPCPPSVNRTRKINWRFKQKLDKWIANADKQILLNGGMRHLVRMPDKFEVIIVLDEHLNRLDLDNSTKSLIDYVKRLGLVIDDDKRHMRKVTIEWGHAPSGCKLILRSVV